MTRKDYRVIAAGLRYGLREASSAGTPAERAINELARSLKQDNAHFDRERFLEAVGPIPKE